MAPSSPSLVSSVAGMSPSGAGVLVSSTAPSFMISSDICFID